MGCGCSGTEGDLRGLVNHNLHENLIAKKVTYFPQLHQQKLSQLQKKDVNLWRLNEVAKGVKQMAFNRRLRELNQLRIRRDDKRSP